MENTINPPSKRRRLSDSTSRYCTSQAECDDGRQPSAPFSHGVEGVRPAAAHNNSQSGLPKIEEVHVELRRRSVSSKSMQDTHHRLHRRQGTAASSDASTTIISVIASVGSDGSTTPISTILPSVPAVPSYPSTLTVPSVPAYPFTSTATMLMSSAASTDSAAVSSIEQSSSLSSNSDVSSESIASSTSGPAEGMIGISATGGTDPSTTPSSSAYASGSNATVSSTGTGSSGASLITGTVSGNTAQTSPTATTTGETNFTTSATTFLSNGATYISFSTIDLGSLTSVSSGAHASSNTPLSSSDGLFFFLATLADGHVATVTESNHAYVTTFPDGEVSTIPAYSTDTPRISTLSDGSVTTASNTVASSAATGSSAASNGITSAASTAGGATAGVAGAGGATATNSSTTSTSSAASSGSSNNNTPPASVLAGGVVGGVAGLAALLLVAMLFLRWYRRRNSMQALPESAAFSPDPSTSRTPGMAERAGLTPLVGAVPALFRHQRQQAEPQPAERGFTRVSGRKLPSAFSEGMSSPPPNMPLTGHESRNLSSTSFYRDSDGFYGGPGPGSPTSPELATDAEKEKMMMSPGPARTPTVHPGGPYLLSPGATPPMSPPGFGYAPGSPPGTAGNIGNIGRGETPTSFDGSRGSKFTEEV